MVRLFLGLMKIAVIAVVVLLIGQIEVGPNGKRITDYVQSLTQSPLVRKPVLWVSSRFTFTDVKEHNVKAIEEIKSDVSTVRSKASSRKKDEKSDQDLLSGLFKD